MSGEEEEVPEQGVSVKLLLHTQTPGTRGDASAGSGQERPTHHSSEVERGPSPGSQGAESKGRCGATSSNSNDITRPPLSPATSSRRPIRWFVECEAGGRAVPCRLFSHPHTQEEQS